MAAQRAYENWERYWTLLSVSTHLRLLLLRGLMALLCPVLAPFRLLHLSFRWLRLCLRQLCWWCEEGEEVVRQ